MNESLMYGSEDEYKVVTLMLSLTKKTVSKRQGVGGDEPG